MEPNLEEAIADLRRDHPDTVLFTGLDSCIVGIAQQWSKRPLVVYDRDLMVRHFIVQDGVDREDAEEHVSHNIDCLWAGEGTPLILQRICDVTDSFTRAGPSGWATTDDGAEWADAPPVVLFPNPN